MREELNNIVMMDAADVIAAMNINIVLAMIPALAGAVGVVVRQAVQTKKENISGIVDVQRSDCIL